MGQGENTYIDWTLGGKMGRLRHVSKGEIYLKENKSYCRCLGIVVQ